MDRSEVIEAQKRGIQEYHRRRREEEAQHIATALRIKRLAETDPVVARRLERPFIDKYGPVICFIFAMACLLLIGGALEHLIDIGVL